MIIITKTNKHILLSKDILLYAFFSAMPSSSLYVTSACTRIHDLVQSSGLHTAINRRPGSCTLTSGPLFGLLWSSYYVCEQQPCKISKNVNIKTENISYKTIQQWPDNKLGLSCAMFPVQFGSFHWYVDLASKARYVASPALFSLSAPGGVCILYWEIVIPSLALRTGNLYLDNWPDLKRTVPSPDQCVFVRFLWLITPFIANITL